MMIVLYINFQEPSRQENLDNVLFIKRQIEVSLPVRMYTLFKRNTFSFILLLENFYHKSLSSKRADSDKLVGHTTSILCEIIPSTLDIKSATTIVITDLITDSRS